eukprot:scaffold9178_cov176-Amphora_coffeaeformis.AAC.3
MVPRIVYDLATDLAQSPTQQDMDEFDFSRIFEDDGPVPEEAFSGATVNAQQPQVWFSFPQEVHIPPVNQDKEFVNLYMIVDPRSGRLVCPEQTLTFKNGSTVSTARIGPSFLADAANKGILNHPLRDLTSMNPFTLPDPPTIRQSVSNSLNNKKDSDLFALVSSNPFGHQDVGSHAGTVLDTKVATPNATPQANQEATNQPLRALSAYNFFFQAERDRIINGCTEKDEDRSDFKKRRLLEAHWNRDRTKKRRHRKSHGRISFVELSKEISNRWKKLPDKKKEFYREVAAMDFNRYQCELQATTCQIHSLS